MSKLTRGDFIRLPIFTVVETRDYLMVKTDRDEWTPVGWETFTATNDEMTSDYFANPKVVNLADKQEDPPPPEPEGLLDFDGED